MKAILRKNGTLLLPIEFAAYERMLVGNDSGQIALKIVPNETIYTNVGSKLAFSSRFHKRPHVWLMPVLRQLGLDVSDLAAISGEYNLMEIEEGKYVFPLRERSELKGYDLDGGIL